MFIPLPRGIIRPFPYQFLVQITARYSAFMECTERTKSIFASRMHQYPPQHSQHLALKVNNLLGVVHSTSRSLSFGHNCLPLLPYIPSLFRLLIPQTHSSREILCWRAFLGKYAHVTRAYRLFTYNWSRNAKFVIGQIGRSCSLPNTNLPKLVFALAALKQ